MRTLLRALAVVVFVVLAAFGAVYFLFPAQVADFAFAAERGAAHLERKDVDIPGFRVAYLDGGSGEPLVLLHGIGADKDNWTRAARWLTPHYRVIAPDLPGFGDSDKPESAHYRIEDQVNNLAAFAQALKIERFDLGGNSMGGWIAASYAKAHPGQVHSLWLLAPAGVAGANKSEMQQRMDQGERIPLFARNDEEFRELLHFVFVKVPYLPGAIQRVMAERQAKNYDLNRRIGKELTDEWQSSSLERTLAPQLATPTLIVWGDHDRVLDVSGAEVLRQYLPNAQVIKMPDVGHVPMAEAPKQAAEDYLRFRQSLPKS